MHIRLQAILYKAQELHMDYRSFLILLLIGWFMSEKARKRKTQDANCKFVVIYREVLLMHRELSGLDAQKRHDL